MLANTHSSCLPRWGRAPDAQSKLQSKPFEPSRLSGTCALCGIQADCGMEKHTDGHGTRLLCPYCHGCLHLQEVSSARTGLIVWAPGISQARLNALTAAIFILRAQAMHRDDENLKALAGMGAELMSQLHADLRTPLLQYLVDGKYPLQKRTTSTLDPADPVVLSKALEGKTLEPNALHGFRLLYGIRAFHGLSAHPRWASMLLGHPDIQSCLEARPVTDQQEPVNGA